MPLAFFARTRMTCLPGFRFLKVRGERQDEYFPLSSLHWKLSFPLPPEPENQNVAVRFVAEILALRIFVCSGV